MSATYPLAVRQFSPKQDATMFVLSAHVNDLQDEVAALERAVGTIPYQWDNGATTVRVYQTVKTRLDDVQSTISGIQTQITSINAQLAQIGPLTTRVSAAEANIATIQTQLSSINNSIADIRSTLAGYGARITALENSTSNVPAQLQSIQNQINALQTGLFASVLNTGQPITPDTYQWNVINWNKKEYDNVGIYSGGSGLVCPEDGWWLINIYGTFPNTRGGATGTQCVANLELRINGNAVISDRKELELGVGGLFGLNCPFAGPWYRGSIATAAINFNPYSGSTPSFSGRASFTMLHRL